MGCGVEVEPFGQGELALQWEVAPIGCEASGVQKVGVVLKNDRRTYGERFSCDQYEAIIDAIEPGGYELIVKGHEEDGAMTFAGEVPEVMIRPDLRATVGLVDLVALKGAVLVNWSFEDQLFCRGHGVQEVELTVFDDAYHEVHRSWHDCYSGAARVDQLRSGHYFFRIRAYEDERIYEGLSQAELGRGDEVDVKISIGESNSE